LLAEQPLAAAFQVSARLRALGEGPPERAVGAAEAVAVAVADPALQDDPRAR
jgi:hypothetical protein